VSGISGSVTQKEPIGTGMAVLFCQPTMNDSGSENSLSEIVEGLRQQAPGLTIRVLAGAAGPMSARIGRHAAVNIVSAPKLRRRLASVLPHLRSYARVYKAIRWFRTENKGSLVVYANSLMFPQAVIGAWLNRVPLVVHVREVGTTYPKVVYLAYFGLAAVAAHQMVGVCAYIFRQKVAALVQRATRIQYEVIHNGAECDTKPTRRALDGRKRILAVIPLTERKGALDLMEFVVELKTNNPCMSFLLDIVGRIEDMNLYARCRRLLEQNGCGDLVRFHGGQSRVVIDEYYAKAHIFVHPSHTEAFPRVLVEAMNHSLPCVTTNAGGSAEAVQEGVTGYIVGVGDYQAMADRAGRLLTDPEIYAAFSTNAHKRYRTLFTRQAMAGRVLRVIDCVSARQAGQ